MEKTRVIVSDIYLVDVATKEEIRIFGEMVFGRAEVDQNFPKDTLISRRHFRLVPAEDVVLIEDLNSTNKTKVNGKLLKPSTLYKLRSRDTIEFGQQKMQIFIGGKIVGDAAKKGGSKKAGAEAQDQSLVFERFVAEEEGGAARATQQPSGDGIVRGVEGLDIQAISDQKLEEKKDEAMLQNLMQKKGAAWYLQFGGSEFGPVSVKELKTVVKSKQFQGGVLFVFTEGLTDWLPVDRIQKFLDESQPEFTATQRIGTGTPIAGAVTCVIRGKNEKIQGKLEAIAHSELTVTLKESLIVSSSLFEVEVEPEAGSGMEPFKAAVKADMGRSFKNTYVLVFVQTTPRTKMNIEKYLRAQIV